MWIFDALIFVLILGLIVFVHELGHFLFAKKYKVHVYAFSLGMGPTLYKFNRKNDETDYFIKAFPIGGYVSLAGEEIEDDKKIPKSKKLQSKTFKQRFLVMVAGSSFNFLLSIVVLLLVGILYGATEASPYVGPLREGYNAISTEMKEGDKILEVGKYKINTMNDLMLVLIDGEYIKDGINFKLKEKDGDIKNVFIVPTLEGKKDDARYLFGFEITQIKSKEFKDIILYPIKEFKDNIVSMIKILRGLFSGKIGIENMAGPVGIYSTVEKSVNTGLEPTLSLIAFLCINIGFVNLLPIPAFDGGRIFFLLIEKIRRKPLPLKVENTVNVIGFVLLMMLMLAVTVNDIGRLLGR